MTTEYDQTGFDTPYLWDTLVTLGCLMEAPTGQ
jgi:hypothetical protein